MISKLLLGITGLVALVNLTMVRSPEHWALPVMLSISASPALRPNLINVILAICTLVAMVLYWHTHSQIADVISITSAILCMAVAFVNRRSAHEHRKA